MTKKYIPSPTPSQSTFVVEEMDVKGNSFDYQLSRWQDFVSKFSGMWAGDFWVSGKSAFFDFFLCDSEYKEMLRPSDEFCHKIKQLFKSQLAVKEVFTIGLKISKDDEGSSQMLTPSA